MLLLTKTKLILPSEATYPLQSLDPTKNALQSVVEFAARLCSSTVEKMYHTPDFVTQQASVGNQRVFEHGHMSFATYGHFWQKNRYTESVRYSAHAENPLCVFSGNLRALIDTADMLKPSLRNILLTQIEQHIGFPQAHDFAQGVAPKQLPDLYDTPTDFDDLYNPSGVPSVTLVATNDKMFQDPVIALDCTSATFLLRNVSHSLTHELLQHRLLSFSQKDQSCVDLDDATWNYIFHPDIFKSPVARQIVAHTMAEIETGCRALRELGIKNEDVTYLLPNAIETTILCSGTFATWKHFLDRRLGKETPWEIRQVAHKIQIVLNRLSPEVFPV